MVSDILAYTVTNQDPFFAHANGYRTGGINNDRLHVNLWGMGEAQGGHSANNTTVTIKFEVIGKPHLTKKFSKVIPNGSGSFAKFFRYAYQENAAKVTTDVEGETSLGPTFGTQAIEIVPPMPPPPPPPPPVPPDPETDPSDPDSDADGDGPCQSPGIYPVNGLYTATAGETKESCLVTSEPYSSVALYVKNPGDTSQYGTRVTEINGDCITSTATLSYTFPSNASGDYLITAVVDPCGHGHYEYSYTVSVTLPPGIYPTDTGPAGATPGTPYELKVITDESYYWIDWYVKRSGEAGLGTKVESDSGGTSTEATMSHTYNVIGDYVITAVIWRGSDMSRYEETYNLRCDS